MAAARTHRAVRCSQCPNFGPGGYAAEHSLALALLGSILAELGLYGIQKIPFTCFYCPENRIFMWGDGAGRRTLSEMGAAGIGGNGVGDLLRSSGRGSGFPQSVLFSVLLFDMKMR